MIKIPEQKKIHKIYFYQSFFFFLLENVGLKPYLILSYFFIFQNFLLRKQKKMYQNMMPKFGPDVVIWFELNFEIFRRIRSGPQHPT